MEVAGTSVAGARRKIIQETLQAPDFRVFRERQA